MELNIITYENGIGQITYKNGIGQITYKMELDKLHLKALDV